MKNKSFKLLYAVMAIMLLLFAIPVSASETPAIINSGACGAEGDNVTWTLYDNGDLVFDGTGAMAEYGISANHYIVPAWCSTESVKNVIVNDGITTIGSRAFCRCNMTSIQIPDSVKAIKANAFSECANLSVVTGFAGVETIEEDAFYYCSNLEKITLPACVTGIGKRVFYYCEKLSDITLGDALTVIGEYAFDNCRKITDIYIGENVSSIGYGAFIGCDGIESFEVNDKNTSYLSDEFGVLYNIDKTTLIKYPVANPTTSYIVPDSVLVIEDAAFAQAFNLTDLKLSANLVSIGIACFSNCFYLNNVILPDSLEEIGQDAFFYCMSFTQFSIPDNVSLLKGTTIYGCIGLEKVTIGKSCNLDYPWNVFYCCPSLKAIEVDEENPYLSTDEYGVIFNKDKTELYFYPCANPYTVYSVPEGVEGIGNMAFYGSGIEAVTLPSSLKTIAEEAFIECLELKDVNILTDNVTFESIVFGNTMELKDISFGELSCMIFSAQKYLVMGDEATFNEKAAELEKFVIAYEEWKQIASFNIHDDARTYTAEAYAQENGIAASRCHFYSEDWTYDYDNLIRYKDCTVTDCEARLTQTLEISTDEDAEIIAPEDPDIQVDVEKIPQDGDEYIVIEEAFSDSENEYEIIKAFDINFKNKDGVHVQPDGTVKVKLPLDWEKDGNYKVYRVNDDGTLTDMNAFRQGSHMVFETDHFSIYVIVEEIPAGEEDTTVEEDTSKDEEQGDEKDIFEIFLEFLYTLITFLMKILTFFGIGA